MSHPQLLAYLLGRPLPACPVECGHVPVPMASRATAAMPVESGDRNQSAGDVFPVPPADDGVDGTA